MSQGVIVRQYGLPPEALPEFANRVSGTGGFGAGMGINDLIYYNTQPSNITININSWSRMLNANFSEIAAEFNKRHEGLQCVWLRASFSYGGQPTPNTVTVNNLVFEYAMAQELAPNGLTTFGAATTIITSGVIIAILATVAAITVAAVIAWTATTIVNAQVTRESAKAEFALELAEKGFTSEQIENILQAINNPNGQGWFPTATSQWLKYGLIALGVVAIGAIILIAAGGGLGSAVSSAGRGVSTIGAEGKKAYKKVRKR